MANEEILNNAPEGWTHYIEKEEYKYWKLTYNNGYQVFLHNGNLINRMPTKLFCIRSRSDIERIVELEKKLTNPQGLQEFVCLEVLKEMPLLEIHRAHQSLHNRIKELEQERSECFLQSKIASQADKIKELEEKLVAQFETLRKMMFEQEKT